MLKIDRNIDTNKRGDFSDKDTAAALSVNLLLHLCGTLSHTCHVAPSHFNSFTFL
jgi:hypothetical protein